MNHQRNISYYRMFHSIIIASLLSFLVHIPLSAYALRPDYRSFDGSGNSLLHVSHGRTRSDFLRLHPARALPAIQNLTAPRIISNRFAELPKRTSTTGINLLHPFFAEIVAHDLVSTQRAATPVQLFVPRCDPYYDPPVQLGGQCVGNATMPFDTPALLVDPTNSSRPLQPKTFTNLRNSWLDLSWLYGLSQEDNQAIRVGSRGKITIDRFFDNPKKFVFDQTLWVRGGESASVNLNPVLHSFFHLFARNHNYWAENYAKQLPSASDEVIFQEARAMNIAEYQNIVARQYLPATVGVPLPPYTDAMSQTSYNASLNPAIDLVFASAAFRYAHPEILSYLPRIGPDLKEIEEGGISLRSSYFNPLKHYIPDPDYGVFLVNDTAGSTGQPVTMGPAVASLFRGLAHSRAGAVEPVLTEDMRNFVFSPLPTKPGMDLFSLGIQICRDQELGTYADIRRSFGLPPVSQWSQVTRQRHIQRAMESVYDSVDNCDPWVCLLAEDPVGNSAVGETSRLIILEQFTRVRNADRFWFEREEYFSAEEIRNIHAITVGKLVARNFPLHVDSTATGTSLPLQVQFPTNSFFLPERQLENFQSDAQEGKVFFPDPPIAVDGFVNLGAVYRVSWKANENGTLTFILQGRFFGWMGIGIGPEPNTMRGADIVLCRLLDPTNSSSTEHECRDSFALDVGVPTLDTDLGGFDDIQYSEVFLDKTFQTFMFIKSLATGDKWDKEILRNTDQKVIFGFNPDTYDLLYHGPLRSSGLSLKFLPEQPSSGTLDTATQVIIGVLSSLGIVISGAFMVFVAIRPKFFHYQESLFCQLILLGTIVGYLSSFMNISPIATRETCLANLWLLHLSYLLVVSSLFIKTWRMYRLLDMSTLQVLKITRIDMLRLVGIHLVVEVAILIAWTLTDPPVPNLSLSSSSNVGCQQRSDVWWYCVMGAKLAYLGFGAFLSVKNRYHAPIFADSREVGISTYVLFITMLIVGVIGIALRQFSYATLIVKSLGVIVPYIVVTFVLFGGTCVSIITGKEPLSIYASSSHAGKQQSEFRSDFTLPEASKKGMGSEFSLALTNDDALFTPRSFYQPSVAFTNRTQAELDSARSNKSDAARKSRTHKKAHHRKRTPSTSSYTTSSVVVSEVEQDEPEENAPQEQTSESSSSSSDSEDYQHENSDPVSDYDDPKASRRKSLALSVQIPPREKESRNEEGANDQTYSPTVSPTTDTDSESSASESRSQQMSGRSSSAISDTTSLQV